MNKIWPLASLLLALAGCGSGDDGADRRTASGEVLEGSISDAMLPLESLTSRPPVLKEERPSTAPGAAAEEPAEGEQPAESAQPPAAPAAQ